MALAEKKCVSCEEMVAPMSLDQAMEMGRQIPGWEIEEKRIERTFTFPDFMGAISFANQIARVAEEENHHPDLHISWGKVRVELSTHKVGGLSENDFILAAKIDALADPAEEPPAI